MPDYKVSLFTQQDYQAYTNSVNSINSTPVSMDIQERRKWWCFDNPNGGAFAAVFADEKVVATCYLSGKSLLINGTRYKAYEIGETATDPAHQRKGLFSKLVKECTKYAFDDGAVAVYGTPNALSTPGYSKLGFDIIDDPRSHLFFSPNIAGLIKSNLTSSRFRVLQNETPRGGSYEITGSEFFSHTAHRTRLNLFSAEYFQWRFNGLGRNRYRFYRCDDFSMAIREGCIGKYNVLLISDFGREKAGAFDSIAEVRRIVRHQGFAATYSGIYLHTKLDNSLGRLGYGLKWLVHHRTLPMCVITNGNPKLLADLHDSSLPQLSDCDIG